MNWETQSAETSSVGQRPSLSHAYWHRGRAWNHYWLNGWCNNNQLIFPSAEGCPETPHTASRSSVNLSTDESKSIVVILQVYVLKGPLGSVTQGAVVFYGSGLALRRQIGQHHGQRSHTQAEISPVAVHHLTVRGGAVGVSED